MKKLLTLAIGAMALAVIALPATAAARDRNHDKIPDKWEKKFNLSLKVNQAHRNQDRDGLNNRQEFVAGDNPRDADTDNDGIPDGKEDAGTIQSFDPATGMLVINVFNDGTVSGLVTSDTEISCENENEAENEVENDNQVDNRDGSSGDNSGSGSLESGDDNSGSGSTNSGDQQGDDDQQGDEGNCTTADLTPGTPVHEAELELANGQAVFEEVELVK
jgi:hypothetical protein